jgi:hypothetical protein
VKNKRGKTALHCAKGASVAEMLLNAGADPAELDGSGCTAAQVLRGQHASPLVAGADAPEAPEEKEEKEEEEAAAEGEVANRDGTEQAVAGDDADGVEAAAAVKADMRPGVAKFASSIVGQAKDAA